MSRPVGASPENATNRKRVRRCATMLWSEDRFNRAPERRTKTSISRDVSTRGARESVHNPCRSGTLQPLRNGCGGFADLLLCQTASRDSAICCIVLPVNADFCASAGVFISPSTFSSNQDVLRFAWSRVSFHSPCTLLPESEMCRKHCGQKVTIAPVTFPAILTLKHGHALIVNRNVISRSVTGRDVLPTEHAGPGPQGNSDQISFTCPMNWNGAGIRAGENGAARFLHGAHVGPLEFEPLVTQRRLKFRKLLWSVADRSRGLPGRDGVSGKGAGGFSDVPLYRVQTIAPICDMGCADVFASR